MNNMYSDYNLLVDSDGGLIQEGPDVYIQNKVDETILLKVALKEIAPFFNIEVTEPYNISTSTEIMPSFNVASTSTSSTNTGKYIIKNWSRDAILQLIHVRQKYDKEFRSTTMKTEKCWQLVVKDMEERGYVSTVNQCRDKWKYLKERYTKKKDNMSTRSSGAEFFKFDFFEEMDSFLGKNASITPVALAASMKPNITSNEDTDNGSILESDGEPPVKKKKKVKEDPVSQYIGEISKVILKKEEKKDVRHNEILQARESARKAFEDKMDAFLQILERKL